MVDPVEDIKRGQEMKLYQKRQEQTESVKKTNQKGAGKLLGKRVKKQDSSDPSVALLFKNSIQK